jgi:hypothetical protein
MMRFSFTREYTDETCSSTIVEYTSALNGSCVPIDYYFARYSLLISYPNITYFVNNLNCSYADANFTVSYRENTQCAAAQVDDDISIFYQIPAVTSSLTVIDYPQPFIAASSPPTFPPTQPPAQDASIAYIVTQQFQGISAATYQSNYNTNNQVVASSVATSMSGVQASNIVIQQVTSSPTVATSSSAAVHANLIEQSRVAKSTAGSILARHRDAHIADKKQNKKLNSRKHANNEAMEEAVQQMVESAELSAIEVKASSDVCYVMYTVNIPSTSAAGYVNADEAYRSTKKQLNTAISNGNFNNDVAHYSTVYNAPTMTGVTSSGAKYTSYVVVEDSSSSSNGLSVGAIVGIAIGGFAGLCLIGFVVWVFFFGGKAVMFGSSTTSVTAGTAALASLEEGRTNSDAVIASPISHNDVELSTVAASTTPAPSAPADTSGMRKDASGNIHL